MDLDKNNFEDDNELSGLEEDDELGGEVVEAEEEELIIGEEEPETAAPAARPAAPKPVAKKRKEEGFVVFGTVQDWRLVEKQVSGGDGQRETIQGFHMAKGHLSCPVARPRWRPSSGAGPPPQPDFAACNRG